MAVTTAEAPIPRESSTSGRGWWVAAWVSVAVAVLGHAWVVRSSLVAGTPSFNLDEIASLMPARALLGLPTPEIGGGGYFPLPAILVSPIWWFTSDPVTFYRVALVVSCLVGLLALWPLTRIATRFGLTTPQALAVSGIVMAVPARTVQAEYLLGEKPLFLIVALTMLAVIRLTEQTTYARALLVSFLVALSYFTHARMPTLIVATAVWFLALALRHLRVAVVGLVSLVVLSWGARWLAISIVELASHFRQDNNLALGSLRPGLLARTIVGQSWSQLVSTFGLASLGVIVIVVLTLAEVRRRTTGPALFLFLAVGAMFAGSTIDWAQPRWLYATRLVRLDVWIYGRYVDPLFALVLLVALAAVVRVAGRREVWASAALSLAIVVVTVLWLAPLAPTGGSLTPAHAPGAAAFDWARPDHLIPTGTRPTFTNDTRFWLIASVVALVPVVVLLLARRRPLVVLAVTLALAAGGTVAANGASDDFHDLRAVEQPMRDEVVRIVREHPGTTVSYFKDCPGHASEERRGPRNRYAWVLLPTILGSDGDADLVIACETSPEAGQPGAVPLRGRADEIYLVWVRPGPLQDALRAEGLLEPVS